MAFKAIMLLLITKIIYLIYNIKLKALFRVMLKAKEYFNLLKKLLISLKI